MLLNTASILCLAEEAKSVAQPARAELIKLDWVDMDEKVDKTDEMKHFNW
jgi:hypothetical protein